MKGRDYASFNNPGPLWTVSPARKKRFFPCLCLFKTSGSFYGAKTGFSIFPVNNFSLDIEASYLRDSGKDSQSVLDTTRNEAHGKLGLSIYF